MPSTRRRREIPDSPRHDPLSELFGDFPDRLRGDRWQPSVDVFENEESVVVRAEIPGVSGVDVRVNVDGRVVRISGVRAAPSGAAVRRLHQMEIAFGPFERAVHIPVAFDRDAVTAHLEDGFLEVTLPKQRPRRRRVEVESQ